MAEPNRCLRCMHELEDASGVCPHCGYKETNRQYTDCLPPRTVLHGRYFVGNKLRSNSESTVYIAYDMNIDTVVTIREYYPTTLARRTERGQVVAMQGREAHFKALMSDFAELTQCLSKMRTMTAMVQVYELFSENGTVYGVYEHIEGVPLSVYFQKYPQPLSWGAVKKNFLPMIQALAVVHTARVYHRGISPDSVYITYKGVCKLDDFAISPLRAVGTELNAQLCAGYAAPEQYITSSWHGPWTDIYAVAALFYRLLTGETPVSAEQRQKQDTLQPILELCPDLPAGVAKAITTAMNLKPEERQQSMRIFLDELLSDEAPSDKPAPTPAPAPPEIEPEKKEKKKRSSFLTVLAITGITILVLILAIGIWWWLYNPSEFLSLFSTSSATSSEVSSTSYLTSSSTASTTTATMYTMPNLLGKSVDEVIDNVDYDGWFDFNIEYDYDNTFESGLICNQSISYGTRFLPVQSLTLTVSLGSSEVLLPSYKGKSESEYIEELEELGIDSDHYRVVYQDSFWVTAGRVISLDETSEQLLEDEAPFDFRGDDVITVYISSP